MNIGFWIFMLIMDLLIPVMMIIIGHLFKRVPREVGGAWGYRTPMSKKSPETWRFAHLHCGIIWRRVGYIMTPLSAALMLLCLGRGAETIGAFGGALCAVQTVALIISVIPTEIALRKVFDAEGNSRIG